MKTKLCLLKGVVRTAFTTILLMFCCFFTFAQRKNLTFSSDYEGTTLLSSWPTVVGRITQSSTYAREGSYSARVEVVKGDPMIASGARSEMNLNPISSTPAEQWFGLSYYIPTSWTSDYAQITDILAQWHSESGTPPIAFGINMADWYVQFTGSGIIDLGAVKKGAWTDVVFHMKWSTGSSGLTEIWINGAKVQSRSGSNFPDTSPGPFFKCGDYKWPWNTGSGEGEPSLVTDRLLYIDAVRVGNASATYADVAPGTSTQSGSTGNAGAVISLTNSTQTITLPTSSVSLAATATDATSSISSISWSQTSGPNTSSIAKSSSLSTTASGLIAGTYVYKLTIIDALSITTTATETVTVVNASSGGPVVSAGINQSVTLPTSSITLSGTATDAGSSISSISWSQTSGPNTSSIAKSSSLSTTASGLIAGSYIYKLTIVDAAKKTAYASVTITVNAAQSTSGPSVNAGSDQSMTLPTSSVSLSGSATDASATISSYTWTQVSGPNTSKITNDIAPATTVTGLVAGTYVFRLTVGDKSGKSNYDQMTVVVNSAAKQVVANQLPDADAGDDQTITLPTSSTVLFGYSSDPDGTIVAYNWVKSQGPSAGTITNPTAAKPTITGLVAGMYIFTLTVTDNNGGTDANSVMVTVVKAKSGSGGGSGGTLTVQGEDGTVLSTDSVADDAAAPATLNVLSAEALTLYPNPAQSVVNVRLRSEVNGNMKINVYDMTGKLVMTMGANKLSSEFNTSFNIAALAHGMYTMQAVIGMNKAMVTKFVKQ